MRTTSGRRSFWTTIFAITFAFGVATGVPMEFQFGTNWANFSQFAGGVIGQTLALEGVFAFFLESSFLGIMLAGERRVGPRLFWASAVIVFFAAWLSAYFILATNAWMQYPVGYRLAADGTVQLDSFFRLLTNPWLLWQYTHNQCAALATGSFVVAGTGAYYVLARRHLEQGRLFLRVGLIVAAGASFLLLFPTGDRESLQVWRHQPIKGAAMEGLFFTEQPAAITIVGQPNMETLTIDNPIKFPGLLSFLTYRRFDAEVRGLTSFPRDEWPDMVPLVYYAYHIMITLGSIFIAITFLAVFLLWRKRLFDKPLDAVDRNARDAVSLHRHDGRVGHGGTSAGSPGWSTACFAPPRDSRPWSRPATAGSRTSGSWVFIFCWASPTSSSCFGLLGRGPKPRCGGPGVLASPAQSCRRRQRYPADTKSAILNGNGLVRHCRSGHRRVCGYGRLRPGDWHPVSAARAKRRGASHGARDDQSSLAGL